MNRRFYGAHPLMIFALMRPFLFVLILPVLRGIAQYLTTGKITGVLLQEILLTVAIVSISVLRYMAFKIETDGDLIIIRQGFLFKSESVINRSKISSVTALVSPIDKIFCSVTYRIDTEAGVSGRNDFSFKLHKSDANALYFLLYGTQNSAWLRFSASKQAVFAAATSSAVTGLVLGVPIVNNIGKILNIALSRILFDEINQASLRIKAVFPPVVRLITLILITGYAISFAVTFLRMSGFRLKTGEQKAEIKSGILFKSHTAFKKSAINDIFIEQTPVMRIFGLFSIICAVGGYGNKKGEKAVIVPAATRKEITAHLKELFPQFRFDMPQIIPKRSKRNAFRFLYTARLYAKAVIISTAVSCVLFPAVYRLLLTLGIILMAFAVYYGNLCLWCYKNGGLSLGNTVKAVGVSGFAVRELYCDSQKVGEIRITRTPADRKFGTCKAEIIIRSESADRLKVRNIDYKDTMNSIYESFKIFE